MTNATPRPLHVIAQEIKADWKNVYFGAVPYLSALGHLNSVEDNFGAEPGKYVVLYFLNNARLWKGPVAKRVKAELRSLL